MSHLNAYVCPPWRKPPESKEIGQLVFSMEASEKMHF
jgi:hypothetical protein